MNETRTDLVKVSTYAKSKNVTPTWIYKLAKNGEIKLVTIDGVKFVKLV